MDDHGGRDSIDVALALMVKQGFDGTSMAQIAEAIGMPLDSVVSSIGTKEAIVLRVAEDILAAVVNALTEIDRQTPVADALLAAHRTVLADIYAGDRARPIRAHAPNGHGDPVLA